MGNKSIDDILSELKGQPQPIDRLLADLEQGALSIKKEKPQQELSNNKDSLDNILQEISRSSSLSPDKETTVVHPSESKEMQTIAQDREKQKIDRAKAWLEKLDRLSAEGMWFTEFAKHYDSELAAAVDYLQ